MQKTIIKKIGIILAACAIIAVSFMSGVFLGEQRTPSPDYVINVSGKNPSVPLQHAADFSIFWDVWSRLEDKFVDKQKIDPEKLVFGAVDGMVKSLGDPYTVFFPPEEAKRFNDDIHGEFGGIGAEIGMRKGILTVISPLKDSPSEHAGILAGDKILKINSTSTLDLTLDEAVSYIRGEKGTPVLLTIVHEKAETAKEIKVIRGTIQIPVTDTKKLEAGIFYIHLYNFNENSPREFRKALIEFQNSGSTKLILDVRNNPGGYLQAAVDMASWFLPEGDVVAREHFSSGEELLYRSVGYRVLERTPVVVLINQGSASASEILAGALRDKRDIKLIGQKSFGKGSVQELEQLLGNASLKVTIAKWMTPNGHSINELGLEPDIAVEIKQEDVDNTRDPQLDKAVEVLKSVK
ncbi:MAG: hypothetical protein A3H69_03420 [Candidatus Sungbacteria bacterium RIFCSPLOWO2_02_FULL_47_9]|uniref:PDZ domain-containing protein n=1 Tax=Candidatus Sungbacteria bacterium RIFCSPHIGHO2_01_FULL_47_32 TaxID=1802264 RepID=A0A1G2K2K1_9BACT|nr:MAG: Carboxyl-terminal protease [Parcubacteria group bacterium GW2011_GWA2_47_10]OGZ93636.1 MAG: hypothetical protein A2633_04755 [Candidatus Sungbacteria bacterium RIFCSPHIGHO2_01_FULL_47_32]OHA05477.1 MAG: hypothetical protein A3A28_03215 [Candidatus Sungbacteria bacterium RIFCSPLOWO2_01_FULL_47_32]OHA11573.1 MAG: hypothetical protein A3H69_03420 [Candidatus Sungbacteria bacterium RIFCSPLOWO2_02_FULL_47_9]